MSKIRLTLATVMAATVIGQPFGGKYLFKLGDAATIADAPQADLDLPSDGTYVASCQSLDVTGAPIPDQITSSITLAGGQIVAPPPPAPAPAPDTYPAPASLSAQILS
jgi:hypothetical protein